eukprot:scaffold161300_cov62-Attheya_sp.AAC.1
MKKRRRKRESKSNGIKCTSREREGEDIISRERRYHPMAHQDRARERERKVRDNNKYGTWSDIKCKREISTYLLEVDSIEAKPQNPLPIQSCQLPWTEIYQQPQSL